MGQSFIVKEGAFDSDVRNAVNGNFTQLFNAVFHTTGTLYYVDPINGNDAHDGLSPATAVKTLLVAFNKCTAGKNDTIYLLSDGTINSTALVDASFDWNKNATHLIGESSGVNLSNRSRISPTVTTTAFASFFTVSASGCRFENIEWFHGFNTGIAAAICMAVTGGRNAFVGCHLAGMGDTISAHDAGSRNLKISGTGENQFISCTIGIDTVARDVANASVEFAGGAPRNQFRDCLFPLWATANTALVGIVAAAAGSDRFQLFDRCTFLNAIKSGAGTAITGAFTLAAAMGGLLAFRDLAMVGVTSLGTDATSKAQMYEFGPENNTSTGVGANPA